VNNITQQDPRIEGLGYTGKPIECTSEEYHAGLRSQIQDAASNWIEHGQNVRAMMAMNEVRRLDDVHGAPPLFRAK
jgi:hypothetical protein